MLLTNYQSAISGLSFDFDTGSALPRRAYVVSTPGSGGVVMVQGGGIWTAEILTSVNGTEFTVAATKTTPGAWRVETRGIAMLAVRLASYQSGAPTGMLTHGGVVPITDVSQLFGALLLYSYNGTIVEPPIGNQIRFNSATFSAVTKIWITNTTNDGTDQYFSLRRMPHGGTLLVQDRTKHADAILYRILRPLLDKGDYIELEVGYQEHTGLLVPGQVLTAVFQPGPMISLGAFVPAARTPPSPEHPLAIEDEERFDISLERADG